MLSDGWHHILYYKRLAVRESKAAPWHWFDRPIAFSLLHHNTAMLLLEDQAVQAVFLYPTQHIRCVQAPSLAAFDNYSLHA